MLELDLLLLPFFDACYAAFAEQEQLLFNRMLEMPDPELHAWLLELTAPDEEFAPIVRQIIDFHRFKKV